MPGLSPRTSTKRVLPLKAINAGDRIHLEYENRFGKHTLTGKVMLPTGECYRVHTPEQNYRVRNGTLIELHQSVNEEIGENVTITRIIK